METRREISHAPADVREDERPAPARRRRIVRSPARRNRQSRLSRPAAVAIFGTVLLCGFSTWQRDAATRDRELARLSPVRDFVVDQFEETGFIPPRAFLETAGVEKLVDRYMSDAGRAYFRELPQPVIVAQGPLVRQYLRYNGRAVVVFRGDAVRLEWWHSGPASRHWSDQASAVAAIVEQWEQTPPDLP